MKQSIVWKLSACACAVLLAACGSSGGGDSTQQADNKPSTQSQSTVGKGSGSNTVASNNAATNNNTTAQTQFGGVLNKTVEKVSPNSDDVSFNEFAAHAQFSGSDLNTIVVNGKEIKLIPQNVGGKWVVTSDASARRNIYTGLSHTRFGVYTDKVNSNLNHIYLLAHGQLTDASKVPNTGKATYVGTALYGDEKTSDIPALNRNDGFAPSVSQFNVDYGNKTIDGTISSPEKYFNSVQLKGNISGNGFAGTHNGVHMEGRFFGGNAEELGGTFSKGTKDNPEMLGSFGAKKQ